MSPATRLTDRKRAAIVQAAVALFRGAGFEATSMDQVAAEADVSKRTVYNHFPSKEALFDEILRKLWGRITASVDLPYAPDRPLDAQLRQLLGQKLDLLGDPDVIDLARVAMAEVIHAPARAHDIVARMDEKEEGVTAWIRAGIADGRLRPVDPLFASTQLQGLVKSFAFWPQVTLGQPPLDAAARRAVADAAVAMFLGHYAA